MPAMAAPLGIDLFKQQLAVATIFDIGEKRRRQIGIFDVMRPGRPVTVVHPSYTPVAVGGPVA